MSGVIDVGLRLGVFGKGSFTQMIVSDVYFQVQGEKLRLHHAIASRRIVNDHRLT